MYNVQTVTDEKEKQEAKKQLVEAANAVNQVMRMTERTALINRNGLTHLTHLASRGSWDGRT